jgi:hypothetical protein
MVARDGHGGLLIADTLNDRIRHVDRHGKMTTVAGTGHRGFCGDGGTAIHACLSAPHSVEYDGHNGFFIADTFNHRIRWVDSNGRIHTVAGNGQACDRSSTTCGENGPAVRAELNLPVSARRWRGGLLIADARSNRVLQLTKDGRLIRIAGTGAAGRAKRGTLAADAPLHSPADAIPYQGQITISDAGNCRVIRVDSQGRVPLVAGSDSTATCQ